MSSLTGTPTNRRTPTAPNHPAAQIAAPRPTATGTLRPATTCAPALPAAATSASHGHSRRSHTNNTPSRRPPVGHSATVRVSRETVSNPSRAKPKQPAATAKTNPARRSPTTGRSCPKLLLTPHPNTDCTVPSTSPLQQNLTNAHRKRGKTSPAPMLLTSRKGKLRLPAAMPEPRDSSRTSMTAGETPGGRVAAGPVFGFATLPRVGARLMCRPQADRPDSLNIPPAESSIQRGPLRGPQKRFAGLISAGGCSTLSSLHRRGVTERKWRPVGFRAPLTQLTAEPRTTSTCPCRPSRHGSTATFVGRLDALLL